MTPRNFEVKTCSMMSPFTRIGYPWVWRKNAIIVAFVLGAHQTSALPAPLACRRIPHHFQEFSANLSGAAWLCLSLPDRAAGPLSTIPGATIRPATATIVLPKSRLRTYGDKRFACTAPKLWNGLSGVVWEAASLDSFRKNSNCTSLDWLTNTYFPFWRSRLDSALHVSGLVPVNNLNTCHLRWSHYTPRTKDNTGDTEAGTVAKLHCRCLLWICNMLYFQQWLIL